MKKRYIIAGNWKMNMNYTDLIHFFQKVSHYTDEKYPNELTKIVCPVFPLLSLGLECCKNHNIIIAAQNVSEHEKGAFTGEVSADILSSIGIKYCIIGHSERRQYYGDTDEIIRAKWLQLRNKDISPIICVGETLEEREANKTFEVINRQISTIFKDMELIEFEDLIIAYEPVWAIGTGKTATPEIAQDVHKYIRGLLVEKYSSPGNEIPLLYGGSVKYSNLQDLLSQNDIDGALVGGASLDAEEYIRMIKIAGELE